MNTPSPLDTLPLPQLPASPASAERPYIAINMVMSIDGKASWGRDGQPPPAAGPSIGSQVDRAWMKKLRLAFDAVARGAGTWRRHPYYPRLPDPALPRLDHPAPAALPLPPVPAQPPGPAQLGEPAQPPESPQPTQPPRLVLFTRSGELLPTPRAERAFRQAPRPILVIAGSLPTYARQRLARAGAVVWELDAPAGSEEWLRTVLARLRGEAAIQRLLLEGGPHLNYEFLRWGVVDELFLTLTPRLIGRRGSFSLAEGSDWLTDRRLELMTVHQVSSELFLRYRVT